jgi:hypothetical protein
VEWTLLVVAAAAGSGVLYGWCAHQDAHSIDRSKGRETDTQVLGCGGLWKTVLRCRAGSPL